LSHLIPLHRFDEIFKSQNAQIQIFLPRCGNFSVYVTQTENSMCIKLFVLYDGVLAVTATRDQQFGICRTATSSWRPARLRCRSQSSLPGRRSSRAVGPVVSQQNPVRTSAFCAC